MKDHTSAEAADLESFSCLDAPHLYGLSVCRNLDISTIV
jgi:hypothetical protein